jgi:hypothetical protein
VSGTPSTEPAGRHRAGLPGAAAQVFAVVGGQAAWAVAVLTAYPMVQIACGLAQPLVVHAVRWVALAIALAATLTGYRVYRAARGAEAHTDDAGRWRVQRVRFTGLGGLLLSAAGAFLLVVEDLATWVIDPCL